MDYCQAYRVFQEKDEVYTDLLTNSGPGPELLYDHIEDYEAFLTRKIEWEKAKAERVIIIETAEKEYIEARLAMNEASGPIGPENENVASSVRWYEAARYLVEDIERDREILGLVWMCHNEDRSDEGLELCSWQCKSAQRSGHLSQAAHARKSAERMRQNLMAQQSWIGNS